MATIDELPTRSTDYMTQLSILEAMKDRRDAMQAEIAAVRSRITAQESIVNAAKQQLKGAANAA